MDTSIPNQGCGTGKNNGSVSAFGELFRMWLRLRESLPDLARPEFSVPTALAPSLFQEKKFPAPLALALSPNLWILENFAQLLRRLRARGSILAAVLAPIKMSWRLWLHIPVTCPSEEYVRIRQFSIN